MVLVLSIINLYERKRSQKQLPVHLLPLSRWTRASCTFLTDVVYQLFAYFMTRLPQFTASVYAQ